MRLYNAPVTNSTAMQHNVSKVIPELSMWTSQFWYSYRWLSSGEPACWWGRSMNQPSPHGLWTYRIATCNHRKYVQHVKTLSRNGTGFWKSTNICSYFTYMRHHENNFFTWSRNSCPYGAIKFKGDWIDLVFNWNSKIFNNALQISWYNYVTHTMNLHFFNWGFWNATASKHVS